MILELPVRIFYLEINIMVNIYVHESCLYSLNIDWTALFIRNFSMNTNMRIYLRWFVC